MIFGQPVKLVRTNLEFQLKHGHFCITGQEYVELIVFAGIAPGPMWIYFMAGAAKIIVVAHFTTVTPGIVAPISHPAEQINLGRKVSQFKVVVDIDSIPGKMTARVPAIDCSDCV